MWAVRWTKRSGVTAEWHYGRRDAAESVAQQMRSGWRTDARVEKV